MNAYDREELSEALTRIQDLEELRDCQIEEIRDLNLALTALQEKYNLLLPSHPYQIGSPYFIRTVTHHHTGRLVQVTEHELVLEDAAWIADDGRFSDALRSGVFAEVEPFPEGPVIIGRGSVIDAVRIWTTPRDQK